MARHTSVYMIDKTIASANLYKDLQNKVYHTGTFKKFFEDRKKEFNDDNMNFDNILETVRNDANFLTPDDLFEITLFLSSQIYALPKQQSWNILMEQIENLYNYYGIVELFKLPSKTVCAAYIFQYGNYTEYYPLDEIKGDDGGANITSENFLHFNDYVILVMKRILESKLNDDYDYQLTEEEEKIVDVITIENQGNSHLSEIIADELKFLIEMSADDHNGPYSQNYL
ncbi:hypothetical protein QWZ06_04615 [Chryseobacterium tructae]|uniref:hypothetical protein n=1 Tax=Chryseobacterium tructae TaxID=1037380 RepID=UPI0025B5022B|nr:hypothetical protein [Chryseobacterium tructae]MDN3691583.1 hypothetical protein [Chryseobacterium tructae]